MQTAERWIKMLPGLLAGGVALIYVLGAIVTGGQFEGVGLNAADAVPLLPIDQILARGIGVLVRPSAAVLIFSALMVVGALLGVQFVAKKLSRYSQLSPKGWTLVAVVQLGLTAIMFPADQLVGGLVQVLGLMLGAGVLFLALLTFPWVTGR